MAPAGRCATALAFAVAVAGSPATTGHDGGWHSTSAGDPGDSFVEQYATEYQRYLRGGQGRAGGSDFEKYLRHYAGDDAHFANGHTPGRPAAANVNQAAEGTPAPLPEVLLAAPEAEESDQLEAMRQRLEKQISEESAAFAQKAEEDRAALAVKQERESERIAAEALQLRTALAATAAFQRQQAAHSTGFASFAEPQELGAPQPEVMVEEANEPRSSKSERAEESSKLAEERRAEREQSAAERHDRQQERQRLQEEAKELRDVLREGRHGVAVQRPEGESATSGRQATLLAAMAATLSVTALVVAVGRGRRPAGEGSAPLLVAEGGTAAA